jgi:hypothetical protein
MLLCLNNSCFLGWQYGYLPSCNQHKSSPFLSHLFTVRKYLIFMQQKKCKYNSIVDARSHNYCCLGKAIRIIYSECVSVSLVIQDVRRMLRITLLSVSCPARPHSFTISKKKGMIFGKKLLNIKSILSSFTVFV